MCPKPWAIGSRTRTFRRGNSHASQSNPTLLEINLITHQPNGRVLSPLPPNNTGRSANCLLYFIALALTEIVTNNAAAAICIPIALSAARALDVSFKPFAMSVIMAASSGFAIPFGYACHLMVMGPGGYTLAHFVKIGLPLDIIIWLLSSWLIPIIWPF